MSWPHVIGQHRIKDALRSARKAGRLPHALLFYGAEGVGKDAMALELARVIRCERGEDEACRVCSSCLRLDSLQHPDVQFVVALPRSPQEKEDDEPLAKLTDAEVHAVQEELARKGANPYYRIEIAKANVIKINSIRAIRRESSLSTTDNRRRVVIISGADAMNDAAANTLLKTLEEPPGDTMLILTTAHRDALLPTILSRCQSFRFDLLADEEIVKALIERDGADPARAELAARLANGSYTHAQELLDDEVMQQRARALDFIRGALGNRTSELIEQIEGFAENRDRDAQTRFLNLVLVFLRDAMVLSHGGSVVNIDQIAELRSFVEKFPAADLPRALLDVEKSISLVERYTYIKLVFAQLAVRLRRAILPGAAEPRPRAKT